jgi:hypothetical protein
LDESSSDFQRIGLFCFVLLMQVFSAQAKVELVPDGKEVALFGNEKRTIRVLFRNTGDQADEYVIEEGSGRVVIAAPEPTTRL